MHFHGSLSGSLRSASNDRLTLHVTNNVDPSTTLQQFRADGLEHEIHINVGSRRRHNIARIGMLDMKTTLGGLVVEDTDRIRQESSTRKE